MTTGYSAQRAAPHDSVCRTILSLLNERGYRVRELPVDGHRPDAQLETGDYVEVKTTGGRNLAIEIDAIVSYRAIEAQEQRRVYIVVVDRDPPSHDPGDWRVNTLETLRLTRGPLHPTGNGSNDDWYQYQPHTGTPFDEWFPTAPPLFAV